MVLPPEQLIAVLTMLQTFPSPTDSGVIDVGESEYSFISQSPFRIEILLFYIISKHVYIVNKPKKNNPNFVHNAKI